MDSKCQAQQVLVGKKGPSFNWARGHIHYILIENLCPFYLCAETFQETEIKFGGQVDLASNFKAAQCSGCEMQTTGSFWSDAQ